MIAERERRKKVEKKEFIHYSAQSDLQTKEIVSRRFNDDDDGNIKRSDPISFAYLTYIPFIEQDTTKF